MAFERCSAKVVGSAGGRGYSNDREIMTDRTGTGRELRTLLDSSSSVTVRLYVSAKTNAM